MPSFRLSFRASLESYRICFSRRMLFFNPYALPLKIAILNVSVVIGQKMRSAGTLNPLAFDVRCFQETGAH